MLGQLVPPRSAMFIRASAAEEALPLMLLQGTFEDSGMRRRNLHRRRYAGPQLE